MNELRARADSYPADLVARRDLARLCVERGRPDDAVALLEEAIAKGLDDPEVFYLLALARLRAGDAGGALAPIVKSVADNERLLLGDPYFVAGEALSELGRWDEAEDALERGLAMNTSHLEGHVRLARIRAEKGDVAAAARGYRSAIEAWGARADRSRWPVLRWYLAAQWALRTRFRG
jgi:predicted Zn-dependent protease